MVLGKDPDRMDCMIMCLVENENAVLGSSIATYEHFKINIFLSAPDIYAAHMVIERNSFGEFKY